MKALIDSMLAHYEIDMSWTLAGRDRPMPRRAPPNAGARAGWKVRSFAVDWSNCAGQRGGDVPERIASAARQGCQCPICGRPTAQQWRPFCSKRCADIDLGRWLKGQYAVPAEEAPEPDDPDC
jgi:uncharacterized protein